MTQLALEVVSDIENLCRAICHQECCRQTTLIKASAELKHLLFVCTDPTRAKLDVLVAHIEQNHMDESVTRGGID